MWQVRGAVDDPCGPGALQSRQTIRGGTYVWGMRLNPRLQGDLGERSAMLWFGARGTAVFVPLFHCRDFDLIADWGEGVARVQVKTSTVLNKKRWQIA